MHFLFIKTYYNLFFFSFSLVCSSIPKEKAGERQQPPGEARDAAQPQPVTLEASQEGCVLL